MCVTDLNGGMQCYYCSWNKLEADNKLAQWVLSGIDLIRNDDCKLQEPDDVYGVAFRNCKTPPDSSYINTCTKVSGAVTGKHFGEY